MSAQHKKLFELKQKQGVVSFNRSSHILLPLSSLKSQQTISDVQVQLGSLRTLPDINSSPKIETQSKWSKLQKISQTFRSPNRNLVMPAKRSSIQRMSISQQFKNVVKFTSSIQFDGLDAAKNIVKNSDAVVVKMQKTQNIDYLAVGLGNSHGNQGLNFSKIITHCALDQIVHAINVIPIIGLGLQIQQSFQNIYQKVEQNLIEQTDFDVKNNGCSLLSLIVVNNTIYCANLGDSKAAFFYRKDFDPSGPKEIRKFVQKNLNFVHDTNNSKEVQRILNKGGKIDQAVYKGRKCGNLKVWVPKQNQPGVKLTRCFGNLIGKTVGISAEPEFSEFKVPKSGYLLIGSTGLWEILDVLVIDQILDAHFPPTCQEDIDLAIKQIGDQTKKYWDQDGEGLIDISLILIYIQM
ncbi:unnamed protein product (macronuclear) [Paramecium tetraurelia]|uniref:protein-serine/threonine phosphatase n=1 Tax=Paramecium tetraurelia TaxID=5888 RepID=A0E421_PARTE|nr:uncharacterized protein GSPATT00023211001 [Paramecium tetraurelia]CAK90038.1 unnamed protein product [Paramecium tetraurelia]|eukprot:XP_001457435.1 hypothetical protein (macronuclear) [Paramecium tetraurelia strain d4-2]